MSLGRFVGECRQHVRGATGEGGEYGIAEPLVAAVPPGQAGQDGQGSGVVALAHRKGELQTDNRRVVVVELQRGGEQFFAFAKPAIGQAQRMPPHARFAMAKRVGERVVVELPEAVERVQRVDSRGGVACRQGYFWQSSTAFEQYAASGLAPPMARAGEFASQRDIA